MRTLLGRPKSATRIWLPARLI